MANLFGRKGFLGLVSIVLTLCLCVGMLVAIPTTVAAEETGTVEIWSGPKSDATAIQADFDTMSKDVAGNYIITNGEQLYSVIKLGGQGNSYKLANDIYLNNTSNFDNWTSAGGAPANKWDTAVNASSSITSIQPFTGALDGDGYTVYGMYTADNFCGALIPTINNKADSFSDAKNIVIKNLSLKNCLIAGSAGTGALVGYVGSADNNAVSIENCTVSNTLFNGIWASTMRAIGSIVGWIDGSIRAGDSADTAFILKNSAAYEVAFRSGNNVTFNIGALVGGGKAYDATTVAFSAWMARRFRIQNCVAVNVTRKTANDTDIVSVYPVGITRDGSNYGRTFTANNVYTDCATPTTVDGVALRISTTGFEEASENPIKQISADSIKGRLAETTLSSFDWNWEWLSVDGEYPCPNSNLATVLSSMDYIDNSYMITSAKQLYTMIKNGGLGYSYKLANDIYINDVSNYANWSTSNVPSKLWNLGVGSGSNITNANYAKPFTGSIDGQGYTVYGLYTSINYYGALIPVINNTADNFADSKLIVIKNLNIKNAMACGTCSTGFLIGWIAGNDSNTVTVENCTVSDSKCYYWYNGAAGHTIGSFLGRVNGNAEENSFVMKNCAATNVQFNCTDKTELHNVGALVGGGAVHSGYTGTFNSWMAKRFIIENSYSINVTATPLNGTATAIYPVGISKNGTDYGVTVTAKNVYTDCTTPAKIDAKEIIASADGATALEDNSTVIKAISSDNMKGLLDSGAWYTAKLSEVSADNLPRLRSNITRFTYADINGDGIDAAYTAADIIPVREYLLGTVDYAYIDGDANASGKIDIRDLVNVYNAVK